MEQTNSQNKTGSTRKEKIDLPYEMGRGVRDDVLQNIEPSAGAWKKRTSGEKDLGARGGGHGIRRGKM